ncbi:unnamed protein product, partial [Iphiclides podalirius]
MIEGRGVAWAVVARKLAVPSVFWSNLSSAQAGASGEMPNHETTSLIATYLILVLLLASLWLLYSGMF